MDKYKKLASNTIIFAIGAFSSKLLTILLTSFYTRVMATGDYGGATLIQNAVNILMPVVTLAVNSAVLRFTLDKATDKKAVFTTGVATTLIGFAIFCLFAPFVMMIKINDFDLGRYFMLLYVMLLGTSLRELTQQFIRGMGHVKVYAIDGVIATGTSALFTILYLGVFKLGINGYILAIFTSDMLSVAFMFIAVKCWKYLDFRRGLKKDLTKAMLKYCIPLIPTIILWWIINVSDQYIVTYFNGVAMSGIYTAAYKIPNLIAIFATIFINAWQLSAVDEYDSAGKAEFFSNVFKVYSGGLLVIGACLITGSRLITSVYLGPDYYESWYYEPVLVIATTFSNLVNFYASIYMAEKKSVLAMLTAGTGAVTNIILNFILIPKMGPQGAAIATAVSFVLVFVIRVFNTKKFVNIKINYVKFMLSFVMMLCSVFVMQKEICGEWGSFAISLAFTMAIVIINIGSVIDIVKLVFDKLLKKRGENA